MVPQFSYFFRGPLKAGYVSWTILRAGLAPGIVQLYSAVVYISIDDLYTKLLSEMERN
jgi:hypothetical protein